jgi:pimeloyl-ACP methyl ester carboxylesterase
VIAMQFALDHPQRVAGLALVGTASECNVRAHGFYNDLAERAAARGMDAVHKALGLTPATVPTIAAEPIAFGHVARAMASLHQQPLTPRVHTIDAPTFICVGDKDFLGVGGSVILSRNIKGSRLEIVAGRGHGIFLEDPDGFTESLLRFLDAVNASG